MSSDIRCFFRGYYGMKLSTTQQVWADAFELSESLIEDAADAAAGTGDAPFNGIVCPDCWRNPCGCAADTMGEQASSPDEKDAKENNNLKNDATDAVAKDLRKKHNEGPDKVSFYPSTERA